MLLLTRRPGEGFQVGEDIHVKVLGYTRGQVRVGITAPNEVLILRDELVPPAKSREDEDVAR